MAKPTKAYSGYDSYGRCVCIAMRADGVWFSRFTEQTGYGTQWTKWAVDSAPSHPKKIKYGVECAGAPEFYEIPEREQENYADWGFSILKLCGNDGIRLPNKDFKYQLAA
jgi:hypothetical protein